MCGVIHDAVEIKRAGYALMAGLLGCAGPLFAAELQPPLQALRHQNFTLIVAERSEAPVVDGRMPVRVTERLRGDPDVPDRIELLVQPGDEALVKPGGSYLIFYSDVERVSLKPRQEVRRPDRRKLLHIDGADPAVFPDTPALRALFDPVLAMPEEDPQYRAVVTQGLRSEDPAMVDLWSAEWAIRPATFAEVRPDEIVILRDVVGDPRQRPAARARLLLAGAERTPSALGRWYVTSAGAILDGTQPVQLAENAGLSQLIYASLRVARKNPDASRVGILEKWLRTAPPLAENAALALRAIDPGLEREALKNAIAADDVPDRTRAFLAEHLRRAELAQQRSQ